MFSAALSRRIYGMSINNHGWSLQFSVVNDMQTLRNLYVHLPLKECVLFNADGLGTGRYSWTMILFPAWNLYLSRVFQVKHYSCSHSVVHTYNFLKSFTLQFCLGWNASFFNYLAVLWLNPGSIKCHTQPDPVTQLHCVIAVNYLN